MLTYTNPNKWLTPDDPDAFLDWPPPLEQPSYFPKSKLCPVCHGHGGWNLRVNAYPLHGRENTQENRQRTHFQAHCVQCHGYGWTNDNCVHEYHMTKNVGRCLNEYACAKCQKVKVVDSSD